MEISLESQEKGLWKHQIAKKKKYYEHITKYNGNVLTHLIFLHDKYIFWNNKGNVLFSFQKYADKMVILGDPIGENADFPLAIEEFPTNCGSYGYTPTFYES